MDQVTDQLIEPTALLPDDHSDALLVGRVFDPETGGPSVVVVRGDQLLDISEVTPTVSDLLDRPDLLEVARSAEGSRSWPLADVLAASVADPRTEDALRAAQDAAVRQAEDTDLGQAEAQATLGQAEDGGAAKVRLLSPIDLQVIKAAGVTFAKSMIERVIEERSEGDPTKAEQIRERVSEAIGGAIARIRPGTPEADRAKSILISEGLWSQYLEVGIGPDPEIFTKAPVLSSVGTGARIGVLARSTWNNPEPEVVLVVSSDGRPVGATLGNDVNLRDFEGRSALLLGEAKDNNGSCAIGPFIRLFESDTGGDGGSGGFDLDAVRSLVVDLEVHGADDGYRLNEQSSMAEMSRTLEELIEHTIGDHHQYPDGFVLFTGTLFAPTQDRDQPGMGFTHHEGDLVSISTPSLGTLINTVTSAEAAPDWTFGIRDLYAHLVRRGLVAG